MHQKLDLYKYRYKCSKQLSLSSSTSFKIANMQMTDSLLHEHYSLHINSFKVSKNALNIETTGNL